MSIATVVHDRLLTGSFSALSQRNFRWYVVGQLVSFSGSWVQKVAQGWLVFSLTRSEMFLGLVACASGLSTLLLAPFAGVLVDRVPRRRLIVMTQTTQMMLAFILAALTFSETVQVWHIVVLAFLTGLTDAIDAPARQTFVLDMVGHDHLLSGITMNSLTNSVSRIFGPAVAGIALVEFGPAWCFFLNGLSFMMVIIGLLQMDMPTFRRKVSALSPIAELKEGLNFCYANRRIIALLLISLNTSIFLLNFATLMPAFADLVLHSPKQGYANLSIAQGVGSVAAALVMASTSIVMSLSVWMLSRTSDMIPAFILVGFAGLALILHYVSLNTLIQTQVPDEFRGRVLSLYTLTFFGIAPFGALALGLLAERVGTPDALAVYSIFGVIISILILLRFPLVLKLP
jgi:MFS family permease